MLRLRICLTCLILASCGDGGAPSGAGAAQGPPNLVWISLDGLRADHATTPALERLAGDGHRFSGVFAQAPSSTPAHAALFTSRRPMETGTLAGARTIDPEVPVLAEWLGQHGYRTAGVFALEELLLLPEYADQGLARGFERVVRPTRAMADAEETLAAALDLLAELDGPEPFFLFAHFADTRLPFRAHGTASETAEVLLDGEAQLSIPLLEGGFWTGGFSMRSGTHTVAVKSILPIEVRQLQATLELEDGDDFYFYALEGENHVIVQNVGPDQRDFRIDLWVHDRPDPETAAERYRLEVEHADRAIGALLDELERRGLYDDSLVVLSSPHGQALNERGHIGADVSLFDELLEAPLLLKLPRDHPRAADVERARDKFLRQIDVAPTLLELLGQPKLPGQVGTSALEGTYRVLVSSTHPPAAPAHLYSLRSDTLKLVLHADEDRFEMFDLTSDPGETQDVFAERGGEVADWQRALHSTRDLTAKRLNPAGEGG